MDPDFDKFDALFVYNTILIKIDKSFAEKIVTKYEKYSAKKRTAKILENDRDLDKNAIVLSFKVSQEQSSLPLY